MSEMIPAVVYYRMSKDQQDKSIPQQEAWAHAKCKVEGVSIEREFRDEGISGDKTSKRDGFREMLRFCQTRHRERRPIKAVVCYSASRFSRADSQETAAYIWQFRQAGTHRILTADRWMDWEKEEDRVMFNLIQDMTEHRYLIDLSRQITRGQADLAKAGYFVNGAIPYGFERVMVNEAGQPVRRVRRREQIECPRTWHFLLVPSANQEEIEAVRWMFHTYAYSEVSIHYLARQLNERGVPGPSSFSKVNPGLAKWSQHTVQGILTNPVYCGDYRWGYAARGRYHRLINGEIRPVSGRMPRMIRSDTPFFRRDNHEAIIDRATWDRVQEKIKARKVTKAHPRPRGYVLTGLVRCGHCGRPMQGSAGVRRIAGTTYSYRWYTCATENRVPGSCRRHSIREDKLLALLVRKLQEIYLAPERLQGLQTELRRQIESRRQTDPARIDRLTARIDALDKDIVQGRRRALQAKDEATFLQYDQQLQEWVDQKKRLERELDGVRHTQEVPLEKMREDVDKAIERLATLGEALATAKPEKVREVLRLLVSRIDLHYDEGPHKKRTRYVFRKGVVRLRPLVEFSGSDKDLLAASKP
jgi:DNA invertase Pin-like site-specific DNA recombinase